MHIHEHMGAVVLHNDTFNECIRAFVQINQIYLWGRNILKKSCNQTKKGGGKKRCFDVVKLRKAECFQSRERGIILSKYLESLREMKL